MVLNLRKLFKAVLLTVGILIAVLIMFLMILLIAIGWLTAGSSQDSRQAAYSKYGQLGALAAQIDSLLDGQEERSMETTSSAEKAADDIASGCMEDKKTAADNAAKDKNAAKNSAASKSAGKAMTGATLAAEQMAVQVISWAVADKLIVLDPGHGGIDPGCSGSIGVEKDINLAVGLKLAATLRRAGATVILTRSDDSDLRSAAGNIYSKTQQRNELQQRAKIANDNNADLFISMHVDNIADGRYHGAGTFYAPQAAANGQGTDSQKGDADQESNPSQAAAEAIQAELADVLGNTQRETKPGDYFVLEHCQVPAVLVEMGFISNALEEKLLLTAEYQERLAWAIYAGIVRFYAENYRVSAL